MCHARDRNRIKLNCELKLTFPKEENKKTDDNLIRSTHEKEKNLLQKLIERFGKEMDKKKSLEHCIKGQQKLQESYQKTTTKLNQLDQKKAEIQKNAGNFRSQMFRLTSSDTTPPVFTDLAINTM